MKTLILASSSPYRKQLLETLKLPFTSVSPDIDEHPLVDEPPEQLVKRLSRAKAQAILHQHTQPVTIIGSDQVGVCEDQILTKPITYYKARAQLTFMSGKSIVFYTGLCVLDNHTPLDTCWVEPFKVTLRPLTAQQIDRYLQLEQPYHCAGALQCEGYGITLIASMHGADPNSLIGLPLIQLVSLLNQCGYDLP